jgi:hypothetical protein
MRLNRRFILHPIGVEQHSRGVKCCTMPRCSAEVLRGRGYALGCRPDDAVHVANAILLYPEERLVQFDIT